MTLYPIGKTRKTLMGNVFSVTDRATSAALPQLHIEQAGAICCRGTGHGLEVLLIGSRRNGRWGIPKGGIDPGEASHEAAAREAFEEAGARGKCLPEEIGVFHYSKEGKTLAFRVHVHVMEVRSMAKSFPEKKQRASQWVSLDTAMDMVWNPELRLILQQFQD